LNSFFFAQSKDTSGNNSYDSVFVMQKSPWGAVLRSAIIPGWGQIYNQSYIKAPIIWGGIFALVLGWRFYNSRYKSYKDLYNQTSYTPYLNVRDFYHNQRDLFSIYIGIVYVLNLVDAYVDAELFDFNVQEDYRTHQTMLGIKLNF
jgi:Family of unknown function (DUF5683)